jgi:hypothetical protein
MKTSAEVSASTASGSAAPGQLAAEGDEEDLGVS